MNRRLDFKSQAKVELHLHLEGAAPPEFIRLQAQRYGESIKGLFDAGGDFAWRDFNDFLEVYERVTSLLRRPEDFAALTSAVLKQSADQGVIYTEVFLGPLLIADNDPVRWAENLSAIDEAAAQAEREHGIVARFINVIIRHFGQQQAMRTAQLTADVPCARLTGFGMAGAEDFGCTVDFAKAFSLACEAGLSLTCHAGEWGDPARIRETIEQLSVSRLGHGVRAVEDESLLALIVERDIHLEVCPGSNVALGVAKDWPNHPVTNLYKKGVSLSVSTDDPPFFKTSMNNEYSQLAQQCGWTTRDFDAVNTSAMRHAFCDQDTRTAIERRLLNNTGENH